MEVVEEKRNWLTCIDSAGVPSRIYDHVLGHVAGPARQRVRRLRVNEGLSFALEPPSAQGVCFNNKVKYIHGTTPSRLPEPLQHPDILS